MMHNWWIRFSSLFSLVFNTIGLQDKRITQGKKSAILERKRQVTRKTGPKAAIRDQAVNLSLSPFAPRPGRGEQDQKMWVKMRG